MYEKLSQIKAVFEETGLAAFLAHIGVEDGADVGSRINTTM